MNPMRNAESQTREQLRHELLVGTQALARVHQPARNASPCSACVFQARRISRTTARAQSASPPEQLCARRADELGPAVGVGARRSAQVGNGEVALVADADTTGMREARSLRAPLFPH